MNKALSSLIQSRSLVHLRTRHPDGTAFDCILLKESKRLIFFQEITSFEPDGIVVLPKRWLLSVRDGTIEHTANAVLRHVQTIAQEPKAERGLFHSTVLAEALSHLQADDIWPAVEVIHNSKGIVYVGAITDVSEKSFSLRCYNPSGEWTGEVEIDYQEVFKLEIESKYVAHFNSYMRSKNSPASR